MKHSDTSDECTLQDVRGALAFIDYSIRDDWVMSGMAIKSEFGDEGFSVWDDWSSQYDKYRSSEARTVWRSFKGGGTSINSLFYVAVRNGYKAAKRSEEEKAHFLEQQKKRKEKRREEIQAEEKQAAAMQDVVASKAFEIWQQLSNSGQSEYLKNKNVLAHGIRFVRRGIVIVFDIDQLSVDLIFGASNIKHFFSSADKENTSFLYIKSQYIAVPLVNEDNILRNIQFILPRGKKLFLKHGQKSGCFHIVGSHAPGSPICVAEGYSTGATIHQATGWQVYVSFDSGNLLSVSQRVRSQHLLEKILICGDDDRETKGNPGRKSAIEAACKINAIAAFPAFNEVTA